LPPHSVIISTRAIIGRIAIDEIPLATNQGFKNIVVVDQTRVLPKYIASVLLSCVPLPPIEIQQDIVAELETEQSLVNANRELIKRFEKKIEATINRVWGDEKEHSIASIAKNLAEYLNLTEEDISEMLPSGRQSRYRNRVKWVAPHFNYV